MKSRELALAKLFNQRESTKEEVLGALQYLEEKPYLINVIAGHIGSYEDGKYKELNDLEFIDSIVRNLMARGYLQFKDVERGGLEHYIHLKNKENE